MRLLVSAWMISLASMGGHLAVLMTTLMLLGKASVASAERAAMVLMSVELAITVGAIVWFAARSAQVSGQPRYGWVIAFGLWQLVLLAVAVFISLVSLNR